MMSDYHARGLAQHALHLHAPHPHVYGHVPHSPAHAPGSPSSPPLPRSPQSPNSPHSPHSPHSAHAPQTPGSPVSPHIAHAQPHGHERLRHSPDAPHAPGHAHVHGHGHGHGFAMRPPPLQICTGGLSGDNRGLSCKSMLHLGNLPYCRFCGRRLPGT